MATVAGPIDTRVESKNEIFGKLSKGRGALFEGDKFATLQASPFAIRGFEFALGDGAVDCGQGEYAPECSLADRLFALYEEFHMSRKRPFLLFDIKGKGDGDLGGRAMYTSTSAQSSDVAFYLGVCAADPSFVELIPNFHQRQGRQATEQAITEVSKPGFVFNSKISRLQRSETVLDPEASPYRMPLGFLVEAIRRVRRCAKHNIPYVNPWTLVSFKAWHPKTTQNVDVLLPNRDTQHYTAFLAVSEIRRAIKAQGPQFPLRFDLVGLQPRLADFKILVRAGNEFDGVRTTQRFVQHKLDSVPGRSSMALLNRLAIGRDAEYGRRWYFTDIECFDYFFYQLEFSNGSKAFFFIPEHAIPDDFYTTLEKEGDFEQFRDRYFFLMDDNLDWVREMHNIISANEKPRRLGRRPIRDLSTAAAKDVLKLAEKRSKSKLPPVKGPKKHDRLSTEGSKPHGRHSYKLALNRFHRLFYSRIMNQCAHQQWGMLLALSHEHRVCDFVFCWYVWTSAESELYLSQGIPPIRLDDIQGDTPVLPLLCFTRVAEISHNGPEVATAQFTRLDSFDRPRLIVWGTIDGGNDEQDDSVGREPEEDWISLVVLPTQDIRPTKPQRERFRSNQQLDTQVSRPDMTPHVSAMLGSGLLFGDYVVGNMGHEVYAERYDWKVVWQLFQRFIMEDRIAHPGTIERETSDFRYPLATIHARLVAHHMEFPLGRFAFTDVPPQTSS